MPAGDVQLFSPPHFNNYYGLEQLMKGEEAISEIEALSKDPAFIKLPILQATYFNRWHIVWITFKHPFEALTSVAFSTISIITGFLHLQKVSRIFSVLSKQMGRDWEQLSDQWGSSSPMLMPAFNVHQTSTWDLYMHGSIPTDFIEDNLVLPMTHQSAEIKGGVKQAMKVFYLALEKGRDRYFLSWLWRGDNVSKSERRSDIQKFTDLYAQSHKEAIDFLREKYPEKATEHAIHKLYDVLNGLETYIAKNCKEVTLFSDKGLCRGASLWFINLYLKTRGKFEDPVKHLIALAEQFKTGVPRQGALLQGFHDTDDLVKLKKTNLKQQRISSFELDQDRAGALKKIETLPTGIYRLGVLDHSLVYIKISKTEGYVWNPSYGLYEMQPNELLDMVLKHNYKPYDAMSHIYFHSYESLD